MKLATDLKLEAAQRNGDDDDFECQSHCVKKLSRETKAGRHASFLQLGNLRSHVQRIHSGEKNFKCLDCSAAFARAAYLKRHQVIHTGDKKYRCEQCGAAFLWSSSLKQHRPIHTGEKPFKCQDCGVAFSRSCSLRRHLQRRQNCHLKTPHTQIHVHVGEKNVRCQYCDAAFLQNGDLKQHIRTHTGENPYKCSASFSTGTTLINHTRTHSGAKPYECRYCPAAFSRSSSLKQHAHIHANEKSDKWLDSDRTFSGTASLERHLQIHNLSESVGSSCADEEARTVFCPSDTSNTAKSAVQCHSGDSDENKDSLFKVKDERIGDIETGIGPENEIAENFKVEIPIDDGFGKCYVTLADNNIDTAAELEDVDEKQGWCNLNVSSFADQLLVWISETSLSRHVWLNCPMSSNKTK